MSIREDDLLLEQPFEHLVHIYDSDAALAECVVRFLAPAAAAEAALVVATPEHRRLFEGALSDAGIDVARMYREGRCVFLDAEETLAAFFVDGEVVPALYDSVIGSLVQALAAGFGQVHVYGEMVACLWGRGDSDAALALERCWNDLGRDASFRLCCAYSASVLGEALGVEVDAMFEAHSHVTGG